jgi:hypothetical protein
VYQIEVAMVGVHTRTAKLDHLAAKRFVRREIKLPLAIITKIRRRQLTGLQAICADNFPCREFLDDQVIAEFVERIGIKPGRVRFEQPLTQLEIKDLKP